MQMHPVKLNRPSVWPVSKPRSPDVAGGETFRHLSKARGKTFWNVFKNGGETFRHRSRAASSTAICTETKNEFNVHAF